MADEEPDNFIPNSLPARFSPGYCPNAQPIDVIESADAGQVPSIGFVQPRAHSHSEDEHHDHRSVSQNARPINDSELTESQADASVSSASSHQTKMSSGHCHDGNGDSSVRNNTNGSVPVDKKARRQLIIASVLCLVFLIGEAVGGILAGSIAILTDAAHLLTDFTSFMISLLAIYFATRKPTKKFSFGWYRAEIMGALLSVMMIWVITGVLVYLAVLRVIHDDYEINADIMLITAGCGVAFNIVMGMTLHQHGHSHGGHGHSHGGHGHSHGGGRTEAARPREYARLEEDMSPPNGMSVAESQPPAANSSQKDENINVRAAFIHVVGDFIQSIGVLIAAYVIWFKPEYKIADPICTFLFSILVVFSTITILRDILRVLMEGSPPGIKYTEVKAAILEIGGVKDVHNLRLWCLTTNKAALSAHVAIDPECDDQKIIQTAAALLQKRFKINESTIQVEHYVADMDDCYHCRDPRD